MKDGVGNQTPIARKEVFNDYLNYYNEICSKGNLKLCQETHVTGGAKRFLLLETDPGERFSTFDFYLTASECVNQGFKDCRTFFSALIKATEMLEIFCVNLFLYPWKKEIKVLKTFTGPFVYCIQPVLTKQATKTILESIGYHLDTDTEYRLTNSADPEKAMKMGFELFLARIECEYLVEVMGQQAQSECLEILQRRAHFQKAAEPTAAEAFLKINEGEDAGLPNVCSLVDPGPVETDEGDLTEKPINATPDRQQDDGQTPLNLEVHSIETTHLSTTGTRPHRGFLNDDRSILEMQKNYPDLAIRQKPIFRKPPRVPHIKETVPAEVSGDISGPQSISIHTSADIKPNFTEAITKLQPPGAKTCKTTATLHGPTASQAEVTGDDQRGDDGDDSEELNKLAERMSRVQVHEPREENLKYPVEETAPPNAICHGYNVFPHQGSARDQSQPLMCHPSLLPICTIPGCSSCEGADGPRKHIPGGNTIKEPPNSIYVPTSLLEAGMDTSSADPALKDKEGFSPQPAEDDLLQTYVMVDEP
ncbi:hypothetical protein UPYG_G00081720 [Umbra pygmaea]|uniref:Spermatogenesis-associated protein 2 PUB-like domain-containing protein n=1 Tax=Umbra pygmaea TaxID=75934 RepID=A0ABD0XDV3_UMBPY